MKVVTITNTRGHPINDRWWTAEPEPGSVVLINGEWGTAFQRHFSDGLWHRVGGGRPKTWSQMLAQRNLVLVYNAMPRTTEPRPGRGDRAPRRP